MNERVDAEPPGILTFRVLNGTDLEVARIGQLVAILLQLNSEERIRAVRYLQERFDG